MRMRAMGIWVVGMVWSISVWADSSQSKKEPVSKTVKIESKKEIKQEINHNIRIQNEGPSDEKLTQEVKYFCSSYSKAEAEKNCDNWLKEQQKTAGARVVFSSCSQAHDLYGEIQHGCMAYLCTGEIKILLNQRK